MKKTAIVIAVLALSALGLKAQDVEVKVIVNQDTVAVENPPVSIREGKMHFDFDVPFYDTIKGDEDEEYEPNMLGLGVISSNSAAPFTFNTSKSLEVFAYSLESVKLSNVFQIDAGCGLGWKNLTMVGSQAMYKDSEEGMIYTDSYPEGTVAKLSRLRVFSFGIPVLLTCHNNSGFGFSLGPVVNINASSCINNKYRLNGCKQKDKIKNVHCNIATVDLMFELNLKDLGLWVKYSPMNLMDKTYWPEIQTVSFGISL